MDTVTLIRSAIRGLLKAADATLESQLRGLLSGADDYRAAGKPVCDWDDPDARAGLIDRLARDGMALLAGLEGRELDAGVAQAVELVATVIGQDLEADESGTFRIVRRVAADRVISTVDPDARHGRKSTSGKFDGYKGHVAIDPDSEIITDAAAGPANAGDGQMTGRLTADLDNTTGHDSDNSNTDTDGTDATGTDATGTDATGSDRDDGDGDGTGRDDTGTEGDESGGPAVYGDAAYGSGDQLAELDERGIDAKVKCQPPSNRNGRFSKDDFNIDLDAQTVSCPAGTTVPIVRAADGSGVAHFGEHCAACPLRSRCTDAARGRNVTIHRHEALLARQRQRGRDPDWLADYRATRPQDRTQARPPHPPRPPGQTSRTRACRCGLGPARRSRQPRTAGHPAAPPHPRRLADRPRLTCRGRSYPPTRPVTRSGSPAAAQTCSIRPRPTAAPHPR
jgi:hypothetical protein